MCRGNIHPDFSATWRLHTKDEELTRFFSHIHQENYKLLVFCEKTQTVPLFILISVTWLMHSNDLSNIIISHFDGIVGEKIVPAICTHGSVRMWMCYRRRILGQQRSGPSAPSRSAPSRKVSAPSRKVTELRVIEMVSFLKYNNKMRIKMNGVNDWIHCC